MEIDAGCKLQMAAQELTITNSNESILSQSVAEHTAIVTIPGGRTNLAGSLLICGGIIATPGLA
jgi:hypothetical protein